MHAHCKAIPAQDLLLLRHYASNSLACRYDHNKSRSIRAVPPAKSDPAVPLLSCRGGVVVVVAAVVGAVVVVVGETACGCCCCCCLCC